MIETKVGLPDTCSVCGQPQREFWHAEHEDAARSGQGICTNCLPKEPEAKPAAKKPAARRRRKKSNS